MSGYFANKTPIYIRVLFIHVQYSSFSLSLSLYETSSLSLDSVLTHSDISQSKNLFIHYAQENDGTEWRQQYSYYYNNLKVELRKVLVTVAHQVADFAVICLVW